MLVPGLTKGCIEPDVFIYLLEDHSREDIQCEVFPCLSIPTFLPWFTHCSKTPMLSNAMQVLLTYLHCFGFQSLLNPSSLPLGLRYVTERIFLFMSFVSFLLIEAALCFETWVMKTSLKEELTS